MNNAHKTGGWHNKKTTRTNHTDNNNSSNCWYGYKTQGKDKN